MLSVNSVGTKKTGHDYSINDEFSCFDRYNIDFRDRKEKGYSRRSSLLSYLAGTTMCEVISAQILFGKEHIVLLPNNCFRVNGFNYFRL